MGWHRRPRQSCRVSSPRLNFAGALTWHPAAVRPNRRIRAQKTRALLSGSESGRGFGSVFHHQTTTQWPVLPSRRWHGDFPALKLCCWLKSTCMHSQIAIASSNPCNCASVWWTWAFPPSMQGTRGRRLCGPICAKEIDEPGGLLTCAGADHRLPGPWQGSAVVRMSSPCQRLRRPSSFNTPQRTPGPMIHAHDIPP